MHMNNQVSDTASDDPLWLFNSVALTFQKYTIPLIKLHTEIKLHAVNYQLRYWPQKLTHVYLRLAITRKLIF